MAREDDERARRAVDKYREFHRFDPKWIIDGGSFRVPTRMYRAGQAIRTDYRSNKVDPETMKRPSRAYGYTHDHGDDVHVYLPTAKQADGPLVSVPARFSGAPALTKLGECLGFAFRHGGREVEVEGRAPLPELYTTPDGNCLLVIQGKHNVLAMIWGGKLGVFGRGIDG